VRAACNCCVGSGGRCSCRSRAPSGGGDDDSDSRLPRQMVECYDGDTSSADAVARWCRLATVKDGSGVHCSGRKPLPESFWWIGGGALGCHSPCCGRHFGVITLLLEVFGCKPGQAPRRATAAPASVVTSLEASSLETPFARRHGQPCFCDCSGWW
jgi:hypothetical protein